MKSIPAGQANQWFSKILAEAEAGEEIVVTRRGAPVARLSGLDPTNVKERGLRQHLIDTCLAMNALGINQGRSGNVSVRTESGFLITPSALPYDALTPSDMVHLDLDGNILEGDHKPSSEWPFHQAVLASRPDAGAVLHAHSPNATALACLRRAIPAFHYMVAIAGGRDIRCAPYATPGSPELAAHILAALANRTACLMANHGMLVLGTDLEDALDRALEVETLADQYVHALGVGEPSLLDDGEMDTVLTLFKTYGKPPRIKKTARLNR